MKCKSCSELIPSKFAHAIRTNICPFCGEDIMEAALQIVLSELQKLMKDAEPYMPQVEEWLSSNYSLYKGNKANINNNSLSENDDLFDEESIKKQTEAAKAEIFQKRAGVKNINKGMSAKSLVEKIQNGSGAADPSEFVGEDSEYGHVDMGLDVESPPLNENDTIQMMKAMNKEGSSDPLKEYYEIEKLKRLQRQPSGQGKFSRGD